MSVCYGNHLVKREKLLIHEGEREIAEAMSLSRQKEMGARQKWRSCSNLDTQTSSVVMREGR